MRVHFFLIKEIGENLKWFYYDTLLCQMAEGGEQMMTLIILAGSSDTAIEV